jgi:PIN domain
MAGLTLDAGALIAFERNDRTVVALLARALQHDYSLAIPAGVVGQVWRDGRRQARLSRLLAADEVEVESLDDQRAREAGQLCGVRGSADVIDASVVLCARSRHHKIVTSDAVDILRLDSKADVISVCRWRRWHR